MTIKLKKDLGECPKCKAGTLEILKSENTYGRYAKCDNKYCEGGQLIRGKRQRFSFAIPKRGEITKTGYKCPDSGITIISMVPTGRRKGVSKAYFWAGKPCFDCTYWCSATSPCEETDDLIIEYSVGEKYEWDESDVPNHLILEFKRVEEEMKA